MIISKLKLIGLSLIIMLLLYSSCVTFSSGRTYFPGGNDCPGVNDYGTEIRLFHKFVFIPLPIILIGINRPTIYFTFVYKDTISTTTFSDFEFLEFYVVNAGRDTIDLISEFEKTRFEINHNPHSGHEASDFLNVNLKIKSDTIFIFTKWKLNNNRKEEVTDSCTHKFIRRRNTDWDFFAPG